MSDCKKWKEDFVNASPNGWIKSSQVFSWFSRLFHFVLFYAYGLYLFWSSYRAAPWLRAVILFFVCGMFQWWIWKFVFHFQKWVYLDLLCDIYNPSGFNISMSNTFTCMYKVETTVSFSRHYWKEVSYWLIVARQKLYWKPSCIVIVNFTSTPDNQLHMK